jgi:hypothetical protein
VDQRTNADGIQDRPYADGAAEQPARGEDGAFDNCADDAHGIAAGSEPGHEAVAWPRSEARADVECRGECVTEDRREQKRYAERDSRDRRDQGEAGLRDQADDDDVGDRAVARPLPQRQPREQDEQPDAVDHPADRKAGALREPLVQHVPRVEAEARPHQEGNAHSIQDQSTMKLDQPSC